MSARLATGSRVVVVADHRAGTGVALCRGPAPLPSGSGFPGNRGSALFSEHAWAEVVHRLGLSHREVQIVKGVFNDQTELAIASELGISPHTVHTYFERLHKKLHVADRVQLILCITRQFLGLDGSPGNLPHPLTNQHRTGIHRLAT